MADQEVVRVGPQGRIVVPARVRRELGLEEGTTLSASVENGRLILEPRAEVLRRLRGRFARVPKTTRLVEELVSDRKAEVKREAGH